MKRVLVILMACFSSAFMFAQDPEYYWTPQNIGDLNMTMYTQISLDGVLPQGEDNQVQNYELGVFDQDGVCRGTEFPVFKPKKNRWVYTLTIQGVNGFNYSFKLCDHNGDTPQVLDMTCAEDGTIEFEGNGTIASTSNPTTIYFTSNTPAGFTLEIDAYSGDRDNYYLIASPVGAIAANAVEGLRTPNFDFFSFDQAGDDEGKEWFNHKTEETYQLQPGVGYLYANNTGTDLTFNGTGYAETVTVTLDKVEGKNLEGWNLVGNPYGVQAYIGRPFYRINGEGYDLISEANAPINIMEGVFVIADEDGEELAFATEAGSKGSMLALNLSNNGKVLDRAIVSFEQGQQLPKFQLFKNSSKLYIPLDNKDYAVVRSEGMGEMPVSFKAESNGTYSLTLSSENAEFSYLHLIDNLTGADQDLLANPSYSFSANTTDYASRFRLVFATANDEDSFAFFSNGSLLVNNEGSAVLQVVDVTGRILKSESINGCASVGIDAAPGVYMVRLVNGDNVKVQKVVK